MNLLNRLTIKSLKMNRKRTIVTIVGIMLATSLITAVSGMASSFQASLVEYTKQNNGNYHYVFWDVPESDLKYFENNRNIESCYLAEKIGYATLADSQNFDKPYLYLMAQNKNAMENLALELKEGRMPENGHEVVISSHIRSNGGVSYLVGDTLALDVGTRETLDGYALTQQNPYTPKEEQLTPNESAQYTVVGIINRPVYAMEPYSAPGYTVITCIDDDESDVSADKRTYDIYVRYTEAALKDAENVTKEIATRGADEVIYNYENNESLIQYETMIFGETTTVVLYGMTVIAILIIIVTSIFCIRNSFAISITEKMKQYGMLSSVGATSKQIRQNVYYEAFVLTLIGVPLGVFAGILALWIVVKVVGKLMVEALEMQLQFSLSGFAIFLAIILSVITIFLSAMSSARRASKVSPIVAIRGNEDIKVGRNDVKSPAWIKRLFGIGGIVAYKNLRRNRKKYRTTIVSIVVSVSIFIGMSAFVNLSFKLSHFYYGEMSYNLSYSFGSNPDEYQQAQKIIRMDGVKTASIKRNTEMTVKAEDMTYTEAYIDYFPYVKDWEYDNLSIISVGETEYVAYLKRLGLSYEEAKDKAVLSGECQGFYSLPDGTQKYISMEIYDMKAGDKIRGTLIKTDGSEVYDEGEDSAVAGMEETIELIAVTSEQPFGMENMYGGGYLIVSDEWMDAHAESIYHYNRVFINCNNADQLQKEIEADSSWSGGYIENRDADYRQMRALYTIVAIFLYGFITVISLIGITNIFNTITTSMELRSKEFAMLRSIGMTKREFQKMIRLESLMYGSKSLLLGIPLGIALSYAFQQALMRRMEIEREFPWFGVITSVLAVFLLLLAIMRYSLNKINKQNIMETIRKENI